MYLAPINYNRFFERIFKKPEIAKRFFEDMLNINITEIEPFPRKTKLTIDAAYVEFDYRCKIDGQYSILDMQQWYKMDVVKRFYMYHCNNTSLQLEILSPVSIITTKKKEYKTRDYNQILPTTTIVWMVDDCLGYKDDIVSFAMTPELLTDFIRNAAWGKNDFETLLMLRDQILAILDNDEKGISFLSKNRLMFVFQKNIIKNPKMGKYVKWFQFAEKTKNENNVEADFELFKNDQIFSMMIEELKVDNFDTDDFQYIVDYAAFEKRSKAYDEAKTRMMEEEAMRKATKRLTPILTNEITKEIRKELELKFLEFVEQEKQKAEQEKQKAEQEKQKAEQEKQKAEQAKQKAEQAKQKAEQAFLEKQLHLVQKCLKRGYLHKEIVEFLEIEDTLLEHYIDLLEKKDQNS